MRRAFAKAALAAAACLLSMPNGGNAFQVMEANAVDGVYCGHPFADCGDAVVFVRWFNYNVPWYVSDDAETDAGDPDLTQAEIISAADAAHAAWTDVPFCILKYTYAGETTARLASDGINNTVWYDAVLDAATCGPGAMDGASGTLAITITTEDADTGELSDVDILYDSGDDWDWSTACGDIDVQTVMTHEYGHAIGIKHTDLPAGLVTTRPTMFGGYFCDAGVASARTLEPDDEAAAQCLYPELPTVVLIDQTGSMAASTRMADAQASASTFVADYADNVMAIAAFADGNVSCPEHTGYDLLQDWTDVEADLDAAIATTYACGLTPLWESTCCAIAKASESAPSNLLIYTDTGENSSDGGECPCITFADVLAEVEGTGVAVYVVDMTNYFGGAATGAPVPEEEANVSKAMDESSDLSVLAQRTGGLYMRADTPTQLLVARMAIEEHMAQFGKGRQAPPTCNSAIDFIHRYDGECGPNSPQVGQQVTIMGAVTVKRGTFDASTQYIQDCGSGIQVFGTVGPIGGVGDSVTVTGIVGSSFGEIRLSPVQSYVIRGGGLNPVAPEIEIPVGQNCEVIGTLASVRGYVGAPLADFRFPLVTAIGQPGAQRLIVFVDPDVGIDPATIVPGDHVLVTGVLTRRLGLNEFKPRGPADYVVLESATGVEPNASSGPKEASIQSVYPNPTRGGAEVRYALAAPGHVRLQVFDVQGRLVRTLVDENRPAGEGTAAWDGANERGIRSASGRYFVKFRAPSGSSETREIVVVK